MSNVQHSTDKVISLISHWEIGCCWKIILVDSIEGLRIKGTLFHKDTRTLLFIPHQWRQSWRLHWHVWGKLLSVDSQSSCEIEALSRRGQTIYSKVFALSFACFAKHLLSLFIKVEYLRIQQIQIFTDRIGRTLSIRSWHNRCIWQPQFYIIWFLPTRSIQRIWGL